MSLYVSVMRILALILNKVRHFYYSFLNGLCFSWNARDLGGAHLSCSGVSPLGALASPHCWISPSGCTERYVRFCNKIKDPANHNNVENPNPNLLSEQIIQILISFKHYLLLLPVRVDYCVRQLCGGIFSEGKSWYAFL